jgi:hypothetical protein
MRQLTLIALLFFCLNLAAAQTTLLRKKVNVAFTDITLEKALNTLKKRYGVRFSYANNLIPLDQKVNVSVTNQPLSVVLEELLKDTDVIYKPVGDQIVLRNDPNKRKESSASDKRPVFPPVNRIQSLSAPTASLTVVPATRKIKIEPIPVQQPDYAAEQRKRRREKIKEVSDQVAETVGETARKVADETTQAARKLDQKLEKRKKKGTVSQDAKPVTSDATDTKATVATDTVASNKPEEKSKIVSPSTQKDSTQTEADAYEHRPFQISFVQPLSTNGTQGGKYINHVSINIVSGYAGGVDGAEFGGVVNMDKGDVNGAQFAGFLNQVGGTITGAQFAGFANIVQKPVNGAQFAGFANITRGGVSNGGQFAGFANIARGPVSAAQAAGFLNVAHGDVQGFQAAGFANIVKGDVRAAQLSGFINTAKQVNGTQIAGFINIARKLNGFQLGVINIADSVDGVQIGLLNFVKHGYYRFEVWGSETMYANAAFKMGSRYFHNIFAVGYRPEGGRNYLAYGYGFGSELAASRNVSLNLDLIAWHVNVDKPWTDELNMLNQFRALVGFRVAGRTQLFLGPTFNVYVSNVYDPEKGRYGIPLTPWKVYDHTSGRTNVVMWPGFNAGIRF